MGDPREVREAIRRILNSYLIRRSSRSWVELLDGSGGEVVPGLCASLVLVRVVPTSCRCRASGVPQCHQDLPTTSTSSSHSLSLAGNHSLKSRAKIRHHVRPLSGWQDNLSHSQDTQSGLPRTTESSNIISFEDEITRFRLILPPYIQ